MRLNSLVSTAVRLARYGAHVCLRVRGQCGVPRAAAWAFQDAAIKLDPLWYTERAALIKGGGVQQLHLQAVRISALTDSLNPRSVANA